MNQRTGRVVAVMPLRDGHNGKTRLSNSLDRRERTRLVAVLARHVVTALVRSPAIDRVTVVTADPIFAREVLGPTSGTVTVLRQPDDVQGLNPALEYGRTRAAPRPAERLLVIHADLPALTDDDIEALLGRSEPVTLAPDRLRTGTNAIVLDGSLLAFPFRFGTRSFTSHVAEAQRLGLPVAVVERVGTATDLDTTDDWGALPLEVRRRLARDVPGMRSLG